MMFHIQIAEIHEEVLRYLPVSGIIGLIFWWEMFFILDNESIPLLPTQRNTTSLRYTVYAGKVRSWTNLETLGNLLYTYYFVWFLVSSLILLVAMIGAIVLTMHRTTKVKRQDVFRRNAIDFRTIMRRTTDPSRSTQNHVPVEDSAATAAPELQLLGMLPRYQYNKSICFNTSFESNTLVSVCGDINPHKGVK
jgi:hypothetical protein